MGYDMRRKDRQPEYMLGKPREYWAMERISVLVQGNARWPVPYQHRLGWCAAQYAWDCAPWFVAALG